MEANTNQRKWFIPCCEDEKCQNCKGSGKVYPKRCPCYYYKDLKNLRYLYENYKHRNLLPFSGSPIDQPKVIIDTFDLIDHYVYLIENIKYKEIQANQGIADKIMKGKSNGR